MDDDDSSGSSPLRFRRALEALTDEQLVKLEKVAGVLSWRTGRVLSPSDLFNEAIAKGLGGERKWPPHVAFEAFFIESMRSIASHAKPLAVVETDESAIECSGADRERAGRLLEMCREQGDEDAEVVLLSLAEGAKGPAIRADLGLSQQQYDTIIKRVRRRAERAGLSSEGGE